MPTTEHDTDAIHAARIIAINTDLSEIALQIAAGTTLPAVTAYRLKDLADQLHFIADQLTDLAGERP